MKFLKNLLNSKHILANLCVGFICFGSFIALFAYFIAPDNTANANTMHVTIQAKPPGFTTYMLQETSMTEKQSLWNKFLNGNNSYIKETPISQEYQITETSIHYKPQLQNDFLTIAKTDQVKVIQKTFWLGTDKYGRDLLSRLIIGARISFSIGVVAVTISLIIGLLLGAIAGYYGGFVDSVIMWLINITWSIPTILLVIAITVSLGKGLWQIYVAVGLTMWVEVARVVRGQTKSVKNLQYIEAAKVLGLSDLRIIIKHIIPNIIGPVIVISASNFAASILVESGLSFLGLGAQPPTPSWGIIIKNHYNYIVTGKAYLAIIPGTLIVLLVLSFMIIGNLLRDKWDVKNND
ncbi:peptide/nickel transport system permease protein [Wenyingzhuangia aestuarii]|uniref:ABC transporter permease n=1 Tax=Wenyingzhuangia aestuarii TaxID=1647582 RepID=UPI00143BF0F3|nr:peptide/nickel transport system permease protein [Wenyingzhuangia aestuarii]